MYFKSDESHYRCSLLNCDEMHLIFDHNDIFSEKLHFCWIWKFLFYKYIFIYLHYKSFPLRISFSITIVCILVISSNNLDPGRGGGEREGKRRIFLSRKFKNCPSGPTSWVEPPQCFLLLLCTEQSAAVWSSDTDALLKNIMPPAKLAVLPAEQKLPLYLMSTEKNYLTVKNIWKIGH